MQWNPPYKADSSSTCEEIPAFYRKRRFITVFTEAHHWSEPYYFQLHSSNNILKALSITCCHRLDKPSNAQYLAKNTDIYYIVTCMSDYRRDLDWRLYLLKTLTQDP
jgi:hypothetical protein